VQLAQAQANRAQAARNLQVARLRLALIRDLPLGASGAGGAQGTTDAEQGGTQGSTQGRQQQPQSQGGAPGAAAGVSQQASPGGRN
jgi:hypothetical protein